MQHNIIFKIVILNPFYATESASAIAIRFASSNVSAIKPTGSDKFSSGCSCKYSSVNPLSAQHEPSSTTEPIPKPKIARCDQPYHFCSFLLNPIEQTLLSLYV